MRKLARRSWMMIALLRNGTLGAITPSQVRAAYMLDSISTSPKKAAAGLSPDESASPARQRFGSLDVGRWLAAAGVVLFHCSTFLQHKPFGGVLKIGYHGVDFFFVLSGFVIAHAHLRDLGQAERVCRYTTKRFLRIYPPYWAALILAIGCAFIYPPDQPVTVVNVVTNFLLVPKRAVDYPFVIPAWTLSYELLFYIFFGLLILLPRRVSIALLVLWPSSVWLLGGPVAFPLSFLFSKFVLFFFFGALASIVAPKLNAAMAAILIGGGAFLVTQGALYELGLKHATWIVDISGETLYGSGFGALIAGFVAVELRVRALRTWVTDYLGDLTYSTYLVHYTLLIVLVYASVPEMLGLRAPWAVCLALFCASVAAGALFLGTVERPAVAICRQALERIAACGKPPRSVGERHRAKRVVSALPLANGQNFAARQRKLRGAVICSMFQYLWDRCGSWRQCSIGDAIGEVATPARERSDGLRKPLRLHWRHRTQCTTHVRPLNRRRADREGGIPTENEGV
jgi:exopolysaccharide production protein ExoZ